MRIAMWSGPRNLSTAMMYAFGNRPDFAVVDEPFYAAYLARSGRDHPMRDEVLASQPTDPAQVARHLLGPIPDGKPHFYQKHMTQHMLQGFPLSWMEQVTNVFLIRHPARVVASFAAKYDRLTSADIGFEQQSALFDRLEASGREPLVIDSHDIRQAPEPMLRALCAALRLSWDPAMLRWPKGGHRADGVWAEHWYGAVRNSEGFAGPEEDLPRLSGKLADLARQAMPHFERLAGRKLKKM